jgi:hypothetical protein
MIDTYPRFRKMRLREHHGAAAEPNPQFFGRGTHPIDGPVLIAINTWSEFPPSNVRLIFTIIGSLLALAPQVHGIESK